MAKAFFRLINISLFVLILASILYGALYLLSSKLSPAYQPLDHPILKESFFFVIKGGGTHTAPYDLKTILSTHQKWPQAWLEVDLQLSKDGSWIVYDAEKPLETYMPLKGKIKYYSFQKLKDTFQKEHKKLLTPEALFKALPNAKFVLDIHSLQTYAIPQLIRTITQFHKENQIIIQSPFQSVINAFKKEKPRWIYGMGVRPFVRAHLWSAIHLEALADIQSDIVFAPVSKTILFPALSTKLAKELARRKIPVILDVHSPQELKNLSFSYKGILTDSPESFSEKGL